MKKSPSRLIVILTMVLIFTWSCSSPLDITSNREAEGNIKLVVVLPTGKSILPDLDLEPAEYEVNGFGPEETTFTTTSLDSEVLVENLSTGEWDISLSAYNAAGTRILEGSGNILVTSDNTVELMIQLLPVSGVGTLTVSINWPAELLVNASASAVLTIDGTETDLTFDTSVPGTAEYSSGQTLASGWYQLEITLKDGDDVVMGAVDFVGIFSEKTTEAVFSFEEVNKPGQLIEITDPDFTIAWDPPEDESGNPITPDGYNIYYRVHDSVTWTLLDTVNGNTIEYLVSTAVLDYGCYEFAVTSVNSEGTESEKHTSRDDTADPVTGWYVDWKQS